MSGFHYQTRRKYIFCTQLQGTTNLHKNEVVNNMINSCFKNCFVKQNVDKQTYKFMNIHRVMKTWFPHKVTIWLSALKCKYVNKVIFSQNTPEIPMKYNEKA